MFMTVVFKCHSITNITFNEKLALLEVGAVVGLKDGTDT